MRVVALGSDGRVAADAEWPRDWVASRASGAVVVGRSRSCDIPLPGAGVDVSRHAVLLEPGPAGWAVRCTGSRGVWIRYWADPVAVALAGGETHDLSGAATVLIAAESGVFAVGLLDTEAFRRLEPRRGPAPERVAPRMSALDLHAQKTAAPPDAALTRRQLCALLVRNTESVQWPARKVRPALLPEARVAARLRVTETAAAKLLGSCRSRLAARDGVPYTPRDDGDLLARAFAAGAVTAEDYQRHLCDPRQPTSDLACGAHPARPDL